MTVYQSILTDKSKGLKKLAVLIDPDKVKLASLDQTIQHAKDANVDLFFIGGSMILNNRMDEVITAIKERCQIPVLLFPGSTFQITDAADGLLFLSLISGRNPEMLIGKHVTAAPYLRASSLEVISTGYMLIDGGKPTSVSYISNTLPIPSDKSDIAVSTALAGEMLGLKLLYLDAGSGANQSVPLPMVKAINKNSDLPIIVGGGIRTPSQANALAKAGADIIVVGNAFESDPELIIDMSLAIHKENRNITTPQK